jgi:MFS family permease
MTSPLSSCRRRPRRRVGINKWILPPVPLAPGQITLLILLGATIALGRYDVELLSLVIPYVQRDIGIGEESVAAIFGLAKLGVILGLVIGLLADRFGRARLLTFTILGFTLATAATAMAETATQFIAAQFFARAFIDTEAGLVAVIAVEELSPRNRGWALGYGAAFAALGSGLAAILFASIEWAPGGWRALYLVGLVGVLLLAHARRTLHETGRFARERAARTRASAQGVRGPRLAEPLRDLLTGPYRPRLFRLSTAQFGFAFATSGVFALQSKHLIEVHGFAPGDITILFIAGGAVAILGNVLGGLIADRVGRKLVLIVAAILAGLGVVGFFSLEAEWMVASWILYAFSNFAVGVVFTAYDTELFPTKDRATAGTVTRIVGTVGYTAGTLSEGLLYGLTGSHQTAAPLLALAVLLSLVSVARLPETANRELEEISPGSPNEIRR